MTTAPAPDLAPRTTELLTAEPSDSDRRRAPRYDIDAPIEVYARGYVIEFPASDLSEFGTRLDPCNFRHVRDGETCLVILPTGDEIPAKVVACCDSHLRLEFLSPPVADARFFLQVEGLVTGSALE